MEEYKNLEAVKHSVELFTAKCEYKYNETEIENYRSIREFAENCLYAYELELEELNAINTSIKLRFVISKYDPNYENTVILLKRAAEKQERKVHRSYNDIFDVMTLKA